jgi:predicted DNA-binding protein
MPVSVRLDGETEALLNKTAKMLGTTKSSILKASIQDF